MKQTITITLHMWELEYDIRNKTDVTGRSRYDGTNDDKVAIVKMNGDDDDRNNMLRSIGNAVGMLKTKLAEWLDVQADGAENELVSPADDITIALRLPMNFNTAMCEALNAAIHQYVVNTAIGDWFSMANKDDAPYYMSAAEANLAQINEAINKRYRPQRPIE